jgi:tetratricopeptide (TPR) repeat protein
VNQRLVIVLVSCGLLLAGPTASWARQGTAGAARADLEAAKALYAKASYEEALARLSQVDDVDQINDVEQYRALCLLALGRPNEAQRSLEQIVTRAPLYTMSEADVSPRLIAMFQETRKRLLPLAAKDLYANGKASFDRKDYAAAATQLRQLVTLLSDQSLVESMAALSDLKQLAEGFLRLSDAEVAAAAARPAPPPVAPPVAMETPAAASPAAPAIYSTTDKDVTPPVEILRTLPRWVPPNPVARRSTFRGIVEVVVDERGAVESAAIRQSVTPLYDPDLLTTAKTWKFRPALRLGKPVKYRMMFEVVLQPASERLGQYQ